MPKHVTIQGRPIGEGHPPYLVAEIGGNFSDFETGARLVELAAQSGVDAVKIQNYRAQTLSSKKAVFEMENTGRASQFELFKKYEIGEALTAKLVAFCLERGVTFFSTPSHASDLELLERFDLPAYKIGSDDAVNIPLLRQVAQLGKPMIVSTGMCTLEEVDRAVSAILQEGNDQIVLLHCTTNYPTNPESVNLLAIQSMKRHFPFPVGYSDHTLGIDTCFAASVLGAAVLEFHFTSDKHAEGPDHMLSKDFEEAASLVRKVRLLPLLLGDGIKRPMPSEMNTRRNNRKSLIVTRSVKAGEKLTPENIGIKRPGYGIPCEHYYSVLGKTTGHDLAADDVLQWQDLF